MQAASSRIIKSGAAYNHLFPKAHIGDHTIMSNAGVSDTVAFIPKVVAQTLDQTKAVAAVLKANDVYQTCHNIWDFVYAHIAYRKDKEGYEQIRSPSRTWHDRRSGVDCDCYTTFISSILTNLGIAHKLRITKYRHDYFQHIYPIVTQTGKEIIMDCVTDKFDYQVPYSAQKDYPMDLQYLDGIDDANGQGGRSLLGGDSAMQELGKLFKKKKKGSSSAPAAATGSDDTVPGSGVKKKKGLKKLLNVANKVNPATLALRNGVLAGMKLNLFNIARRLRWSYITPNQAKAKGIQMERWHKLVAVRQKLENIFYGAGGNPDNLKKAVLKGKGNKDKAVHGLDGIGFGYAYEQDSEHFNQRTPLSQLLGAELFYSENPMSALGELGEPATAASVTAASGVLALIASAIKKIGDIFGGSSAGSKDFDESTNKAAATTASDGGSTGSDKGAKSDGSSGDDGNNNSSATNATNSSGDNSGDGNGSSSSEAATAASSTDKSTATKDDDGSGDEKDDDTDSSTKALAKSSDNAAATTKKEDSSKKDNDKKQGEWDKNKKWIIPVGIGVGVLSLLFVANQHKKPAPAQPADKPVDGLPKKKNHQRTSTAKKKKVKFQKYIG